MAKACANCRFHLAKPGVCRANPPVPFIIEEEILFADGKRGTNREVKASFPPVVPENWCGRWEQQDTNVEIVVPTGTLDVRPN